MTSPDFYVDLDGMKFAVAVDDDYDAKPSDYECYADRQIATWENSDWRFVILTVWPTSIGEDAGTSLGGLEWGHFTNTTEDDTLTGHVWLDEDYYSKGDGLEVIREMAYDGLSEWLGSAEARIADARSWLDRTAARWAEARAAKEASR